jgi:S-adenosylmethionine decarboxylase
MARISLAKLGVVPVDETKGGSPIRIANTNEDWTSSDENKDYFKEENGLKYAGTHLILDIWNAENINDLEKVEAALTESVQAAGATLLHIHLHHFTPNDGISGVAVLSESHISIHTWPERKYAALDIFMCGDAKPHLAVPILRRAFGGNCQISLVEHKRGLVEA